MPIHETDPWREQYFQGVTCPDDVHIPTDDGDAWLWYPRYRWIYNKLAIAESQGFACGPHGVMPEAFPVFSKPIYNMRGMGAGSRIFKDRKSYKLRQRAGHFWMPLMQGEHVSTDAAVVDGEVKWWRHVTGESLGDGMFDYWVIHAAAKPEIEDYCGQWTRTHLAGYSGMANFETIGGRIIEAHLRFSDQWPDLYGAGWLDALVGLYAHGRWQFDDRDRRDGYSVVLFGAHGIQYQHPPKTVAEELLTEPGITSVQVTFHEDRPPEAHSMPPGGFRLAIVNGTDLAVGRAAREKLALAFWSTKQLLPQQKPESRKSARRAAGG